MDRYYRPARTRSLSVAGLRLAETPCTEWVALTSAITSLVFGALGIDVILWDSCAAWCASTARR